MDVKGIILSIILFLIIWFVSGFVAFLIEARRVKNYEAFDKRARQDFVYIAGLGLLSFVIEMFLVIADLFCKWIDRLLKK